MRNHWFSIHSGKMQKINKSVHKHSLEHVSIDANTMEKEFSQKTTFYTVGNPWKFFLFDALN